LSLYTFGIRKIEKKYHIGLEKQNKNNQNNQIVEQWSAIVSAIALFQQRFASTNWICIYNCDKTNKNIARI